MTNLALWAATLVAIFIANAARAESSKITKDNWWYQGCESVLTREDALKSAKKGLTAGRPGHELLIEALDRVHAATQDRIEDTYLTYVVNSDYSEGDELSWRTARFITAASLKMNSVVRAAGRYSRSAQSSPDLIVENQHFVALFLRELYGDVTATGQIAALKAAALEEAKNYSTHGKLRPVTILLESPKNNRLHEDIYVVRQRDVIGTNPKLTRALLDLVKKWQEEGLNVHFVLRGRLYEMAPTGMEHYDLFRASSPSQGDEVVLSPFFPDKPQLLHLGDGVNVVTVPAQKKD
jgi:hypothetical protein